MGQFRIPFPVFSVDFCWELVINFDLRFSHAELIKFAVCSFQYQVHILHQMTRLRLIFFVFIIFHVISEFYSNELLYLPPIICDLSHVY